MTNVELSVIVMIGEKGFGLERFLNAFINTQPTEKIQIILIYPEATEIVLDQNARFASVRHLKYGKGDYFKVVKQAIEQAEADYILFQEAHTYLKVNIIDAFLRYIHTDRYVCIGSLVYPNDNLSFWGWVSYLENYSMWSPGTKGGEEHEHIPGHNCVYKKSALLDFGNDLEIYLYADSMMQQSFRERGMKLFIIDETYLIHDNKLTFTEQLAENFWYGWLFAYARRTMNHWGPGKRLLYSVLVFGKPLIRFTSLVKKPLGNYSMPGHWKPAILMAILVNYYWNALGESCGALFSNSKPVCAFNKTN